MSPRRILLAATLGLAALGIAGAPNASADERIVAGKPGACAWALTIGVCVNNPFESLPPLPDLP
jgi:hypothetical protein